jgi:hypothetical protein
MSRAAQYWDHYQTSQSLKITADHFGVSVSAVRSAFRNAGYKPGPPGRKPSGKDPKELTRERVRRYRLRKQAGD